MPRLWTRKPVALECLSTPCSSERLPALGLTGDGGEPGDNVSHSRAAGSGSFSQNIFKQSCRTITGYYRTLGARKVQAGCLCHQAGVIHAELPACQPRRCENGFSICCAPHSVHEFLYWSLLNMPCCGQRGQPHRSLGCSGLESLIPYLVKRRRLQV